jgi:hypothetical protein
MPMVVGRDAAQTPSRLSMCSSSPAAMTSGGAHYRCGEGRVDIHCP